MKTHNFKRGTSIKGRSGRKGPAMLRTRDKNVKPVTLHRHCVKRESLRAAGVVVIRTLYVYVSSRVADLLHRKYPLNLCLDKLKANLPVTDCSASGASRFRGLRPYHQRITLALDASGVSRLPDLLHTFQLISESVPSRQRKSGSGCSRRSFRLPKK